MAATSDKPFDASRNIVLIPVPETPIRDMTDDELNAFAQRVVNAIKGEKDTPSSD
jgi:hypothetical protein